MNLKNKTILITGGTGFLGTHVCNKLREQNLIIEGDSPYPTVFTPRSTDFDLTDQQAVKQMLREISPDIIIHLAAVVGGIGANQNNPGLFYYKNMAMGLNLMEEARRINISKFVAIGSICAYPKNTIVPFKEEDIWNGYPEETNAPYGLAKKMMLVQAQAYRQQYGFNAIYLLPVNLYGPNDNFNPESSHVIPALIKKCIDARDNENDYITCWGTGSATREFLYVDDAADAIVTATDKYNGHNPVNIGSGIEISIKRLITIIADMCNYQGKICWDKSKPDGQPRRCLDTSRALSYFNWKSKTTLEDGLRKTIEWYENENKDRCISW